MMCLARHRQMGAAVILMSKILTTLANVLQWWERQKCSDSRDRQTPPTGTPFSRCFSTISSAFRQRHDSIGKPQCENHRTSTTTSRTVRQHRKDFSQRCCSNVCTVPFVTLICATGQKRKLKTFLPSVTQPAIGRPFHVDPVLDGTLDLHRFLINESLVSFNELLP